MTPLQALHHEEQMEAIRAEFEVAWKDVWKKMVKAKVPEKEKERVFHETWKAFVEAKLHPPKQ